MNDISIWISLLAFLAGAIGVWVKLNSQIAKLDTRAQSEKTHCDGQFLLVRAEIRAVESRSTAGLQSFRDQLNRIDGKVDRLLERHP